MALDPFSARDRIPRLKNRVEAALQSVGSQVFELSDDDTQAIALLEKIAEELSAMANKVRTRRQNGVRTDPEK